MWIPLAMISILVLIVFVVIGPVLKFFGVVEWSWSVILAPIWVPLTLLVLWLLGWGLFWALLLSLLAFIQK